MSLASDILKRAGGTSAARGQVRIKKNGEPDGRFLTKGKPKPHNNRVLTHEHAELKRAFEAANPGEQFAWNWRRPETYRDLKLRNAQLSYAYKIANTYGYKVSISARPKHMLITFIGLVSDDD